MTLYSFTGSNTNHLDNYFTLFYPGLLNHVSFLNKKFKQILNDDEELELLNDTYIRLKDRLITNPLTGATTLSSYVLLSFLNEFRRRSKYKKHFIYSIDNPDNEIIINDKLEESELFNNNQEHYDSCDRLTRALFDFIRTRYDDKHTFLFKTYYLTKINSYRKLSTVTGLKYNYIKNLLSAMKADVKNNFKFDINNNDDD